MTGPHRVEAAGVVVPAHNEEELLPACLAALREAAGLAGIPVQLLVVADACTDETAAVAAAHGAQVRRIRARNVGAARAAGLAALLRRTAGTDPAAVWLATTDADTIVPPGWLRRQLGHAGQGWDVVLGTVTVTDWAEHPAHTAAAFAAMYGFGEGPHPHVHGANLGIRASAYLAAGGFKPLRTSEDHALIAAVTEAGGRVLRAGDVTVETSARRQARAPRGFSHVLRVLSREPVSGGSAPAPARHVLPVRPRAVWWPATSTRGDPSWPSTTPTPY
jgi:glycosyltransferase involved in cell wall biosynthesis